MEKYKIDNAVDDLIPIFIESGYTEKTVIELRRNIQKVVDLHQKSEKEFYNAEIVAAYISDLKEKYASGLVSRSRKNALIKAALYVSSIATTGTILPGEKKLKASCRRITIIF